MEYKESVVRCRVHSDKHWLPQTEAVPYRTENHAGIETFYVCEEGDQWIENMLQLARG